MKFIKKIILGIIASWVAIYATTDFLPEYLSMSWWIKSFLIAWLIFWILNAFIKPILKILSLPFIIITAWLFYLVINSIIVYLTEYVFINMPTLQVTFEITWGIVGYLIVWLVLSIINWATHWLVDI